MTKRCFKLTARVKQADVEFKEGLGVGVLATMEVHFDVPDHTADYVVQHELLKYADDLMKELLKVDIEPVDG